jgi:hypothetical protein
MTKATKVTKPDAIHCHVEKLTGGRGQLVADGGQPTINAGNIRPLTAADAVA